MLTPQLIERTEESTSQVWSTIILKKIDWSQITHNKQVAMKWKVKGVKLLIVRIMPLYPLFPSISPYLCKTSCPKHNVKLHNYALTITTTTRGTCLWSKYPVLVIICELEVLTSRPSVAS